MNLEKSVILQPQNRITGKQLNSLFKLHLYFIMYSSIQEFLFFNKFRRVNIFTLSINVVKFIFEYSYSQLNL